MSEVPFRACPSSSMTIEEIEIPDCKGSSSGVDLREPHDWTRDVGAIGLVLRFFLKDNTFDRILQNQHKHNHYSGLYEGNSLEE